MKKVFVSLVAVVGLLVAGENSAKEVIICTSVYYDHENAKQLDPYSSEIMCYGKGNKDTNGGSKLSFEKLYSNGWHFVGNFKSNGMEPTPVYLVFEKNK